MLRKTMMVTILLLGLAALAGCGKSSGKATVTGTGTYLQRIALPPDAVMTTRIAVAEY